MSFIKQGEALEISKVESVESGMAAIDPAVLASFQKFAKDLKRIAPKADDFLYFSAIMLHAAEAAGLNHDGTPKLTLKGEPVQVGWDKSGNTWRWTSSDPLLRPYKNSNGDIFPEEELVKAHKKWVGKPLCVDHKSSSVEHVRGFIVDTYYDRNLKRVIGLCALDKSSYPQLARQISTGVSNAVSMGTAVGKAICTDCARVARSETDFCDHMRRKCGYGEINVDLNPIELSIVVNGADPKANIKHIIAAANTLNAYVDNKQKELQKLAQQPFTANLSFETSDSDPAKVTQVSVSAMDLEAFRADVDKAIKEYQKLQSSLPNEENVQESGNDMASTMSSENAVIDTPAADSGLALPHARYASADELHKITTAIEFKLGQMKQSLDTLTNNAATTKIALHKETTNNEEHMSGNNINKQGYFQGGGGVNEPTPGQPKYTKDPLNEQLRDHEDKQMVGQNGFPGVGPVDGMHPSPVSTDESNELERKKMLARAESEERAMRRQSIVDLAKRALEDKKAYFQGGGGVNEPTPGKVKYPKDKLNEELRDNEDKQMVGQKPFPGVGPVDGLHPSPVSADVPDEKKRKEMLQRASLRARFVKAANDDGSFNQGKSVWEVFLGDKLLLTASVNELLASNAMLSYDDIATKPFGANLIEKVKKQGADKVVSLIKKAQPAPAAPPADAASVTPAAPAGDMAPPADAAPEAAEDTGKSGDPKENVLELAEKARDLTSDLVEGVRALTGEAAEMGEGAAEATPEMGTTASFSDKTLNMMRKELNGALTQAMKESAAALKDHREELQMIARLYDKGAVNSANSEFVGSIVQDAVGEAKSAIADGLKLMTAFVKYARGTQAIVKRAEIEAELAALATDKTDEDSSKDSNDGDDLMAMISDSNSDMDHLKALLNDDNSHEHEDHDELEELLEEHEDDNCAMLSVKPGEAVPANLPEGVAVEVKKASLDTKEGRAVLRAKLAADALGKEDSGEIQDMSKAKFSDMLDQADDLANGQTKLDVKPSDNLGLVETQEEQNKAFMEVAKAPPNVRKEAEAIQKLIVQGKLDPRDVDALVAEGLDKDAVAYWKKYYGQTEGGSEFATELVKEHVKAQLEEELNKYRVKLARAYELAYDMVDRGLCLHERSAISSQVDEIMKFNDDSFNSLKRVVAKHEPVMHRTAGRLPQVGLIDSDNVVTAQAAEEGNLYEQLSAAFSTTSKRMF